MINFDNAATTFPKPDSVRQAAAAAILEYGGNPGRSGHDISLKTAEMVYDTRKKAADFFGAESENTVFTLNCTHALNFAMKGVLTKDSHVIISELEHNSVWRPVYSLSEKGCGYSVAAVSADDNVTVRNVERLITPKTRAVIFTMGSNVTGQLTPYAQIGKLCKMRNICFIADGAQVCGIKDINIKRDNINILCAAAHKGLYAAAGTGLLISDGKYKVLPMIEGGTGSTSIEPAQPDFLPDSLESGTVNTVGICTLSAGLDFVKGIGAENICKHEMRLCNIFISLLSGKKNVIIYRKRGAKYLPIVLFNVRGVLPEETAGILNDKGFALRGGLHCAPLAHKSIGTLPDGAVRFAPSVFNTEREVYSLAAAVASVRGKV